MVHVPRGVDEYLELLEDRAQAKQNGGSSSAAGSSSKGEAARETLLGKGSVQSGGTRDASSGVKDSSGSVLSAAQARDIRKKLQSLERKMNTAQRKVDEAKQAQLEVDPYDYVALGEAQIKVKECERSGFLHLKRNGSNRQQCSRVNFLNY